MNMPLDKVRTFIEEKKIFSPGDAIIAGLSGGADSVCLFRMLVCLQQEYRLSLYALHVNHGIRGKDAEDDEMFAKELADSYGIPFKSVFYPVSDIAKNMNMTIEEAGRYIRYRVFEEERKRLGADKIAVAHHKNDQVETILFRMCRGTGIKGLLGMDAERENIIRPLMCLQRNEIIEYLKDIGQDYREDATNRCTDYDRNRIRHKVIPQLENINEAAVEHIAAMSDNLRQIYDWMTAETDKLYRQYVKEYDGYAEIGCNNLVKMYPAARTEIIRRMINTQTGSLKDITMRHIDMTVKLAEMETGKNIHLPYGLCAEREYGILRIKKEETCKDNCFDKFEYILNREDIEGEALAIQLYNVYLPDAEMFCEKLNVAVSLKAYKTDTMEIPKNNCTKWFDYDRINCKLSIRRPQEDDYFVLSNGGTKKITRYMIDCKVPRKYRDRIVVAADGSHVLAVLGGRIGEDYYVNDNTESVLELSIG